MVKKRKGVNTARTEVDVATLRAVMKNLPGNPIPWLAVLRIVAPIIVRLGVRYALKRVKRSLSEERVTNITDTVSGLIEEIVGDDETSK